MARRNDYGINTQFERDTLRIGEIILGDGERQLVTATRGPGGGDRFLVGGQELIQVAVVLQGIGSDLPSRPDAEIVHWYTHERIKPDLSHPHDQFFPAGPLLLYRYGQQGAVHDAGDENAITPPNLGADVSALLDKSERLNHATASGTARPKRSGRVNWMATSESLSGWGRVNAGVGALPVITPSAGFAPDGTMTAVRVDLNCIDASSSTNRSYVRSFHVAPQGTKYRGRIWLKAATPGDVGKEIRLVNENTVAHGNLKHTLTADWVLVERDPVRSSIGSNSGWLLECRGATTQAAASVLVWHPDYRYLGDDAGVPEYQPVRDDADYDTAGFPVGAWFDGVDDGMVVASGGGGAAGFFWSGSIRLDKIGVSQTLFSDAGTNTGYRVRINASNQLELSAGNGSAYTSIATTRALSQGDRVTVTTWHDGVSLYVQIDDDTPQSTAFATASAGTAGYAVGKDNGAASGYFAGLLYTYVYLKDTALPDASRAVVQAYCAGKAKLPVDM